MSVSVEHQAHSLQDKHVKQTSFTGTIFAQQLVGIQFSRSTCLLIQTKTVFEMYVCKLQRYPFVCVTTPLTAL